MNQQSSLGMAVSGGTPTTAAIAQATNQRTREWMEHGITGAMESGSQTQAIFGFPKECLLRTTQKKTWTDPRHMAEVNSLSKEVLKILLWEL